MLKKFYYILHPRPAYAIGSGSMNNNEINFMAASWVMPCDDEIKAVVLACEKENRTFELIEKYKQYSINVVDDYNLLWKLGTTSGKEIDKVKKFNLKVKKGNKLDVPVLENALGVIEAKVINFVDVGAHRLFIGEVVDYYGDVEEYGLKEFWKVPLHKGGKAFASINKYLNFIKD
jgi:flavin reductase (DIM6/NTAB) family NADH-FMN oxidoreductase RutF